MDRQQFKFLLDLFTWYREHGLSSGEAFLEACEDYVFLYGVGSPRGILDIEEKEVMPAKQ